MIYASITVLALAAAAAMPSLGNLIHMHPRTSTDTRISVLLVNRTQSFRDVKVDGHIYTVTGLQTLAVKGPAGTTIYAASTMPLRHRGDTLLTLTPEMNHKTLDLK